MWLWLLLTQLALAAPEMIPEEDSNLVGRTAPEVEAPFLDGGSFTLSEQRGKPVILAFWASWCGPCRLELPALDALQKQRDDIAIFAVNVDREQAKAKAFLKQVPIDLPVVWDNQALALGAYQVLSMPTIFLVDKEGTLKLIKVGYSRERKLAELEAVLEGLQ
jgi:thiol-disulfide isomerase/thioredoxin